MVPGVLIWAAFTALVIGGGLLPALAVARHDGRGPLFIAAGLVLVGIGMIMGYVAWLVQL